MVYPDNFATKAYLIRYKNSLDKIGIAGLFNLPEYYKRKLREETDLIKKVNILEEITALL